MDDERNSYNFSTANAGRLSDSKFLLTTAGYTSSNCSALSYAITSSLTWINQDPTDQLEFSILVNEDPSLVGEHTLTVEMTSDNYSS